MVHGILYSVEYKYILMYSAKCGCCTVKRFFRLIHQNPSMINHYISNEMNHIPPHIVLPSVPKIVVVRNPYYRVVSMFTNKFVSNKRGPLIRYSFIKNAIPIQPFTFIAFLNKLIMLKRTGRLESNNCHIQSQVYNLIIDRNTKIIKLENMKEDIKNIYKNHIKNEELYDRVNNNIDFLDTEFNKTPINTINKNIIYERFRPTTNEFPEYYHFYNQKVANMVYRLYKNDFIKFGYSKDSYPKFIEHKE
jgi:hypothetical protein